MQRGMITVHFRVRCLVKRRFVFYTPIVVKPTVNIMTNGIFWKSTYGEAVTPELNAADTELRDLFVREFLFDFDPVAACLRCGFLESYAQQYAQQFMGESYVRKQIAEQSKKGSPVGEDKEKDEATKQHVLTSLFREANYRGPGASHGSRVAALAKIATIMGMDAPTKMEQTITHKGGVMAVPGIASIEDWEQKATENQSKLMSEAEN